MRIVTFKRLIKFILAVVLPVLGVQAQTPDWKHVDLITQINGTQSSVTATTTDATGNVFLTGFFTGAIDLGTTRLTSLGYQDIFVAKWNPLTRRFLWAQRAGGTDTDIAHSITVSGPSVYIAGGYYSKDAAFGPVQLPKFGPAFDEDAFVAKLTDSGTAGTFVWAYAAGGPQRETAYAVAASGPQIYVAGSFISATAEFGGISLPNTASNSSDAFVALLVDHGPNAAFAWARRAGSPGYDQANALAVGDAGVYVAGSFAGPSADFGSLSLRNAGRSDAFVAKLTDAGAVVWAQGAGGTDDDAAFAVQSTRGTVYVAGNFSGPAATFGSTALASSGAEDLFVAKVADEGATGRFAWAQAAGGLLYERAAALVVRGTSVYVAGDFGSSIAVFGPAAVLNASAAPYPPTDVFVAKLEDTGPSGRFLWAQSAGGAAVDEASSLGVSGSLVYVGGKLMPPASFGGLVVPSSAAPFGAGFLAALEDARPLATTLPRAFPSLHVFPNPSHGLVTAAVGDLPAGVPLAFSLWDATGREVQTLRVTPTTSFLTQPLRVAHLPAGLYLLKLQTGGTSVTQRLVVE